MTGGLNTMRGPDKGVDLKSEINGVIENTKSKIGELRNEIENNKIDPSSYIPNEEEDINNAVALNDQIQEEAGSPDGYNPPSDLPLDKDGNPIY